MTDKADKTDEYKIVVKTTEHFQRTKYYDYTEFQKLIDYQNTVRNRGWNPPIINYKNFYPVFHGVYITGFSSILEAKLFIKQNRLQKLEKSIEEIGGVNIDTSYGRHKLASLQGEAQKTDKWIKDKYLKYPEYYL